ncbi:MAG: pilus assembly protein CpaE [Abditibacteriota bacterium]|nr:pilus assembly protein CpaE [Abditibacteriota bacterium]
MAITALIADSKSVSRQELVGLLGRDRAIEVIGDSREGQETIEMARSLRPNVVLLDGGITSPDAVTVVENMQLASSETAVIVLIDGVNIDLVRRLMRAGARDCLVKPVGVDDLLNTIRSVHHQMQKQRAALDAGNADAQMASGQMIAVYSPQGGAGKSILAANLGVALAKAMGADQSKGRVALVDLNLQFGDIDLMLNLSPDNTIAGLAQKSSSGLDAELVEQYLTVHEESGLRVLVAPSTPQHAESITVYTVEQVLDILRGSYQFVIVDTPSQLQDTTLAALDASSMILLTATLDLLALHKTRIALDMLRQLYVPEKIQVVLNRANSDTGISIEEVEESLGVPVRLQIPSDGRTVVPSVNEGKPFVLSASQTPIARRVNDFALELLGRETSSKNGDQANKNVGFLKKLFG